MAGPSRTLSTVALALALLTAAAAGCLSDTDDSAGADDAGVPETIGLDGCREVLGVWDLAYEEVAGYLPPGFEPHPFLRPTEDTTGRNASMHLLALTCTEPYEASLLIPWLPVIPPDRFAHPDADVYRVMLPCIGDASIAEILLAWGAPCQTADATIEADTGTPIGATWVFDARSPNLTVRMEGTAVATGLLSQEPIFRQFHVADRQICAITHLELEDHIHWEGHRFQVEATGDARFPTPDEPGQGLLALPGFQMLMTPVDLESGATTDACPL